MEIEWSDHVTRFRQWNALKIEFRDFVNIVTAIRWEFSSTRVWSRDVHDCVMLKFTWRLFSFVITNLTSIIMDMKQWILLILSFLYLIDCLYNRYAIIESWWHFYRFRYWFRLCDNQLGSDSDWTLILPKVCYVLHVLDPLFTNELNFSRE